MKLLIVVPNYPNTNSSAYQFVHERVKEYQKKFEVSVFCYNKRLTDDYIFENITVHCGNKEKLKKFILDNTFDSYIFHFLNLSNARFILSNLKEKRVFVWFHGSDSVSYKRRLDKIDFSKEKLKQPKFLFKLFIYVLFYKYRIFKIKQLNNRCKDLTFVFVSNWNKEASSNDLKIKYKKCVVIPNYVNEKEFIYKEKTEEQRYNILSINNYSSNIYAGDMIRDIILSFSENKIFNKFNFSIYGTGKHFKEYTDCLKKFSNVTINEKNLNHQEIIKLHNENGIFLYPKRGDSQGVSRCEAMASGLVPIASDVEAISEFSPKNTSYLVNSIDDFIKAFENIDKNPKDYLSKSINGANYIKDICSYQNTIQKEINMLEGKKI